MAVGHPSPSGRAHHRHAARSAGTAAAVLVAGILGLAGCVAPGDSPAGPSQPSTPGTVRDPSRPDERDLAAIRALAGVFDVSYSAASAAPGATTPGGGATQAATAREAVLLVEDGPDALTLEHLLLIGDPPVVARHWSQTWTYRPRGALRYGPNGWFPQPIENSPQGRWRVRVAEADAQPLFDAIGAWEHDPAEGSEVAGDAARWRQDRWAARPPDRRGGLAVGDAEGWSASTTLRVGPAGWVWISDGQTATGVAVVRTQAYQRLGDAVVWQQAAASWWATRSAFWRRVHQWWDRRAAAGSFRVRDAVDGRALWSEVFALEQRIRRGELTGDAAIDAAIDETIRPYVVAP